MWCLLRRKKPTNWRGQERYRATKIRSNSNAVVGGCIFTVFFSNFIKCRIEVAGDVISSGTVDYVGMDAGVKFGDSTLNTGGIIRLCQP